MKCRGVKLMTNHGGGNFKKQFARADKWGARIALVLGESEVADGTVVVKDLRPVSKRQWRRTASPRICALYWAKEKDSVEIYENEHDRWMRLNASLPKTAKRWLSE